MVDNNTRALGDITGMQDMLGMPLPTEYISCGQKIRSVTKDKTPSY